MRWGHLYPERAATGPRQRSLAAACHPPPHRVDPRSAVAPGRSGVACEVLTPCPTAKVDADSPKRRLPAPLRPLILRVRSMARGHGSHSGPPAYSDTHRLLPWLSRTPCPLTTVERAVTSVPRLHSRPGFVHRDRQTAARRQAPSDKPIIELWAHNLRAEDGTGMSVRLRGTGCGEPEMRFCHAGPRLRRSSVGGMASA